MGQTVEANGRSILHKGHGTTHAAAPPDVCKTPSPGGPVPIPYPNFAMDSNLASGASSVKIEGNPVANVKSKIATSTGDEAGTIGGIMSNVFKGTCTWKMGSPNVKAEGECVVRFLDSAFHNGNGFNDVWVDGGKPADGYANDFDDPCPLCKKDPQEHGIPSVASSADVCAEIVKQLKQRYDDNKDRAARNSGPFGSRRAQEQANRDLIRARQKSASNYGRGQREDPAKLGKQVHDRRHGVQVPRRRTSGQRCRMKRVTGLRTSPPRSWRARATDPLRGNVIQGGAATIQQFAQANRNVPQAATIAELTRGRRPSMSRWHVATSVTPPLAAAPAPSCSHGADTRLWR